MSMPSFATIAASGGSHEVVWDLPIPAWSYGAIALAIFMLLLLVVWSFRNSGHTLMTGSDIEGVAGAAPQGRARGGHSSTH